MPVFVRMSVLVSLGYSLLSEAFLMMLMYLPIGPLSGTEGQVTFNSANKSVYEVIMSFL